MVLHDERTLKSTIQKNLPKSQIFARKISLAEFRYSQTNLLWFTVILVHSNLNKKVTSNEQKVTNNEQKIRSNKQIVRNNEQKATSNDQKVQPLLNYSVSWYHCKDIFGRKQIGNWPFLIDLMRVKKNSIFYIIVFIVKRIAGK